MYVFYYVKSGPLQLGVFTWWFVSVLQTLIPSIQSIYRKLHPYRALVRHTVMLSHHPALLRMDDFFRGYFTKNDPLQLGVVDWWFVCLSQILLPSMRFIYRRLHPNRANSARVIIIFPYFFMKNGGHLGFLNFFEFFFAHVTFVIHTVHLSKTASKSNQ